MMPKTARGAGQLFSRGGGDNDQSHEKHEPDGSPASFGLGKIKIK